MKIEILLKDPDVLSESINEAVEELKIEGLSEGELEAVKEKRKEEMTELCSKWFEYGEYLKVEVDTDKETCTVVPLKD